MFKWNESGKETVREWRRTERERVLEYTSRKQKWRRFEEGREPARGRKEVKNEEKGLCDSGCWSRVFCAPKDGVQTAGIWLLLVWWPCSCWLWRTGYLSAHLPGKHPGRHLDLNMVWRREHTLSLLRMVILKAWLDDSSESCLSQFKENTELCSFLEFGDAQEDSHCHIWSDYWESHLVTL